MCNFFSAIVRHLGYGSVEILHKLGTPQHTDHHTGLAEIFGIPADADHCAKVEYVPTDTGEWQFRLDEERIPIWWDEDVEAKVIDELDRIVSSWQIPGYGEIKTGGYKEILDESLVDAEHPTRINANGTQLWYLNGNIHREDGPAVINANGTQLWYLNGKRHRTDGPAVINANGTQLWYLNGKLHRTDGPAVICSTGEHEWWVEGVEQEKKYGKNQTLKQIADLCYQRSYEAGWHENPREKGTMFMLIVSEISEAMEGERKDLMDDKLPHRKMAEVELADAVIRIFDYCGKYNYDIESAILEKLEYNLHREDHKMEVRQQKGGKKW